MSVCYVSSRSCSTEHFISAPYLLSGVKISILNVDSKDILWPTLHVVTIRPISSCSTWLLSFAAVGSWCRVIVNIRRTIFCVSFNGIRTGFYWFWNFVEAVPVGRKACVCFILSELDEHTSYFLNWEAGYITQETAYSYYQKFSSTSLGFIRILVVVIENCLWIILGTVE